MISVVSATYNRAKLLDKALRTYQNQDLPKDQWEYIIVDDMSDDNTKEVVEKYIKKGLPLVYLNAGDDLKLPKEPGEWRDGCKLRNVGSTFAHGDVICLTHPEIMIPDDALRVMQEAVVNQPHKWVTAIPYWMPKGSPPRGWMSDINKLREMDGFYKEDWPDEVTAPGAIDYTNNNQEVRTTWESEVFWAMSMRLWREIGGFRHFDKWGSIDMDFLARRKAIGIPTTIAVSEDTPHELGYLMVYHQWHESKRDMNAAMNELQQKNASYATRDQAIAVGGLQNVRFHGHREKAENPENLNGIMGDHIARYRWAGVFAADKTVLDIPCGTGYGSKLITNHKMYYGVDIDTDSIDFAIENYLDNKYDFDRGDMLDIPHPDEMFDRVFSFEGIEHLKTREDQQKFVDEMWRVLKPNGTFILSTPQRGAAKGTLWDVNILSASELKSLFSKGWKNLDWFYQNSYGATEIPIQQGQPPSGAEIMILGGTKDGGE